jgi:preprotein translocase subunit SecE
MKKQTPKARKKKTSRRRSAPAGSKKTSQPDPQSVAKAPVSKKAAPSEPKRPAEKRGSERASPFSYLWKASQFLREARMELKKVKWPTRKELLASTAVVIVLTLIVAFFLGLVDFGLIKIMKSIIG